MKELEMHLLPLVQDALALDVAVVTQLRRTRHGSFFPAGRELTPVS